MGSTGHRINMELVSSLFAVTRKDVPLADPLLARPLSHANPLSDGEWMLINGDYKAIRACDVGSAGNAAAGTSFPVWAEEGRWDVQATTDTKVPLLIAGDWEMRTRLFDAAAVVGSGAAITAVLQPLKVASITINGIIKSGLVGHGGAADASPVVGRVWRLPSATGGWLQLIKASTI